MQLAHCKSSCCLRFCLSWNGDTAGEMKNPVLSLSPVNSWPAKTPKQDWNSCICSEFSWLMGMRTESWELSYKYAHKCTSSILSRWGATQWTTEDTWFSKFLTICFQRVLKEFPVFFSLWKIPVMPIVSVLRKIKFRPWNLCAPLSKILLPSLFICIVHRRINAKYCWGFWGLLQYKWGNNNETEFTL